MTKPVRTRVMIDAASRVRIPRHVKLRHDPGRGRWIVLAPERVFNPDEIAVSVLQRCDGERTVGEIAGELAAEYKAPANVILADIVEMLQDLSDKGVVDAHPQSTSERSANP
jgi:pyrroloquinoline quinone biosynthesis protein D